MQRTNVAEQELIDLVEAERLTGLARSTLYKLIQQKKIRSFKVLNARRLAKADVLAMVREQAVNID